MTFTIKDRLHFSQRIEDGTNYIDSIIKNSIKNKLALSIDEIVEFNIRDKDGGISWDNPSYVKDIIFYDIELDILKKMVEQMDENGEIDFSNIDICSQIMG